jgi:hypothetical protein
MSAAPPLLSAYTALYTLALTESPEFYANDLVLGVNLPSMTPMGSCLIQA